MTKTNQPDSDERKDPQVDEEEVTIEVPEQESAADKPREGEPAASLEAELEKAREESRLNQERYLRAVADWENYRRRMTREKEELRQHVTADLIEKFLPVLDNLSIGLQTAANHPEAENVAKGFAMVGEQILNIFAQNGVTEIDPAGEAFDPHQHEAMTHQPHPEIPEGHVAQVIRKGYSMNGRLLRAASVVVSSGPPAETEASE